MSDLTLSADNNSGALTPENAPETVVEQRLADAGVRVERSASVEEGIKACYNHDDQRPPTEVSGNFTVHGGGGLVILDVDVPTDDLPEWVQELPPTFVVESPHGGHHPYYALKDDTGISNVNPDWGSIRYEGQYVVGPGSTIDHAECDDGKTNCPGEGIGTYDIVVNKPIATLSGEHLEHLREACDSSGGHETSTNEYGGDIITLPDDALVDEGERYICTEFTQRKDTGDLAAREIMHLLRGGTGSYELQRDDGTGINRSAAEYYTLDALYGAFRFRGEDGEDARKLTLAVFKRYCRENPYDKTGNVRKWLAKGDAHIEEQMDTVQEQFDWDDWHRWRRREYEDGFDDEPWEETDDIQPPWADPAKDGVPSLITQDTVRAALHILTTDLDPEYVVRQYGLDASSLPPTNCGEMFTPRGSTSACDSWEYPTAKEVGAFCAEINPDREASYFAETVKTLCRETDEIAHAYCPSRPNGERHVYHLRGLPHPDDARWVKSNGEELNLDDEGTEVTEQKVMTDGGKQIEESRNETGR